METPQLKLYLDTSDGNILSNIRWIDKCGAVTWPYFKMVKSQKYGSTEGIFHLYFFFHISPNFIEMGDLIFF